MEIEYCRGFTMSRKLTNEDKFPLFLPSLFSLILYAPPCKSIALTLLEGIFMTTGQLEVPLQMPQNRLSHLLNAAIHMAVMVAINIQCAKGLRSGVA